MQEKINKHIPSGTGKGSGLVKRDNAVAPASSKPSGSHTTKIRSGQVARSTGSFKSYK